MTTQTVLLCGVGGQGTILAADLLARAAMNAGRNVKVSEIHGMAQRGGAVTTVVRFGEDVRSMVSDAGCADVIVSFETTEALRNQSQTRRKPCRQRRGYQAAPCFDGSREYAPKRSRRPRVRRSPTGSRRASGA